MHRTDMDQKKGIHRAASLPAGLPTGTTTAPKRALGNQQQKHTAGEGSRDTGSCLTLILDLAVGHLHGRGRLREGVEDREAAVRQAGGGGVHHGVRAGVHHVAAHRGWHGRCHDGRREGHWPREEIEGSVRPCSASLLHPGSWKSPSCPPQALREEPQGIGELVGRVKGWKPGGQISQD